MTHATLREADCLFLPRGWHHHVFSVPDPHSGSNIAVNIWTFRRGDAAAGVRLGGVQRLAEEGLRKVEAASPLSPVETVQMQTVHPLGATG